MLTAEPKPIDLAPGIHPDVEWDDYRAIKRMNPSTIWHGMESMLELKSAIDGLIDTDSDDKKFGREFHARLLEPKRFKAEFVAMPAFEKMPGNKNGDGEASTSKATKFYKSRLAEFEDQNKDKSIIEEPDMDAIERMAKQVYAHKVAKLLHAAGGHEVSIIGEHNGIPYKTRADKLIQRGMPLTIVDLKKIRKADRRTAERACHEYGYCFKASIQIDLVRQHLNEVPDYIWVFVEDSPPHDVFVLQFDDESYRIAQADVRGVEEGYKRCLESDVWPGRCDDIFQGGYPDWYRREAKAAGGVE